jgi:hypothetical protein
VSSLVKTVEAHITAIYKAFQEKPGDLSLQVIAELAVRDGLVTAADLAELP